MLFILIALILYLAANGWVYYHGHIALQGFPLSVRIGFGIVFWAVALSFILLMYLRGRHLTPLAGHWFYQLSTGWLVALLYLTLLLAIGHLPRLIGVHIPHLFAACTVLTALLLIYGHWHYRHPDIRTLHVDIGKVAEGRKSLRAVAISDVHLGYGNNRRILEKYVKMINEARPDVVLIAGDLIDMSVTPLWRERMQDVLRQINAPQGIYMVPGNHEFVSGIRESEAFIARTPICLLRDSIATLPGGIQIVGRDDRSNRRRMSPAQLLAQANPDSPILVLDHQPYDEELEQTAAAGADFELCGHTHNGQVWPLSLVTDAIYRQPYGYGRWGQMQAYVSSGLGLWGPPFRIGTRSEMVIIDFSFR
ncbi:metallophosphoesterase [Bacteroidales bacterium SW292]|nr:metallophosphoesterase [Bacteroidales bacterium SW292]